MLDRLNADLEKEQAAIVSLLKTTRVDVGIDPYETEIVQGAAHRKDKVFRVSVISSEP